METTNTESYYHPIPKPVTLVSSLEDRYDRIIEVIARSESAEQVAPELWLELVEIIRQLESE